MLDRGEDRLRGGASALASSLRYMPAISSANFFATAFRRIVSLSDLGRAPGRTIKIAAGDVILA